MNTPAPFDAIQWATDEANRLRQESTPWDVREARLVQVGHELSAGIHFLQIHAPGTDFARAATQITQVDLSNFAGAHGLRLAGLLDSWVTATRAGLLGAQPFAVAARIEAATDLMEQVEQLLSDGQVHPAGPIMLAGAALEELLRSLWEKAGQPQLHGKPAMNSYADALAKANVLSRQEVKDVTSMAGRRNDAAHGDFEKVNDPAIARLMVDQVNLFLSRHTPR